MPSIQPASAGKLRSQRSARGADPAVESEKRRQRAKPRTLHLCDGPGWPPDDETCGRMIPHEGRCAECSDRRTKLRKAERRREARLARAVGRSAQEPAFPLF